MSIPVWAFILIIVGVLIVGFVVGFFVAKSVIQKYIDKNPPITEAMIRAMMSQMGRTPSQKQVNQVMASMKAAKDK